MRFLTAYGTDVGAVKAVNQDSICIKEAETESGTVLMAVICDGMGGLEQGEVASAKMIEMFGCWFEEDLPFLLSAADCLHEIHYAWERMIKRMNQEIGAISRERHIRSGTTVTAWIALPDNTFLIGHVGDTRAYRISDETLEIITEDQTLVAREIKAHRLTAEEAENDPRRSVLLQCVGASRIVEPAFYTGHIIANECFLLCSDGFRHEIRPDEIKKRLCPGNNHDEAMMQVNINALIELDMKRCEKDNISAVLIKVTEG